MNKLECVQIEITNCCNYKCANCPRSAELMTRPQGYMGMDLLKKIIDESFKVANFINFSFFGEPLLHPKFSEIMDYVSYMY